MVFNSSLCFSSKTCQVSAWEWSQKTLGCGKFGILEFWGFGDSGALGVLVVWSFGVLDLWSFRDFGVLGVLPSFCPMVWGQPLGSLAAPCPGESHFAGMSSPGICWDGIFICGASEKFVPNSCKFCKSTQPRTFPAQFLLCHVGQRLGGKFFIFLLKSGCSSPL